MSTEVDKPKAKEVVLSPEVKALLAQAATEQDEKEASTIPSISIKGKKFSIGDEKLGTSMDVVILADVFDHAFYDRKYDPDVITPPACWALNASQSDLAPDPDTYYVPKPQSESCANCPKNQFGSSDNGKGKACRNGRRMLVASVYEGKVNLTDLAIINAPPTSLKGVSRYFKQTAKVHKLPTWAVVTNVSFDEDTDWPSLVLERKGHVPGDVLTEIIARNDEFLNVVSAPYDCSGYEEVEQVDETKKSKMS